jgi:hypothetical protein
VNIPRDDDVSGEEWSKPPRAFVERKLAEAERELVEQSLAMHRVEREASRLRIAVTMAADAVLGIRSQLTQRSKAAK